MVKWRKEITVSAERELPYHYTCLYCGKEK